MEKLKKEDFKFTFESKGNTFLFENLVISHYMPGRSIIFSKGDKVRTFADCELIEKVRGEGEKRKPKDIKVKMEALKKLIEKTITDVTYYKIKKNLTIKDVKGMLDVLASIIIQYSYFDHFYWEGVYEKKSKNKIMQEIVDTMGSFKNDIRAALNPIFFDKNGYMAILLNKISLQYNVPVKDLNFYQEKEVIELFEGKKVDSEEIKNRSEIYLFYKDNLGKVNTISGNLAQEVIDSIDTVPVSVEIIKGKVAHGKGRIILGKVKIISRDYSNLIAMRQEMVEMQKGDILVTETTDPEMLPAMKKSSAIITDIGGMLSHAAITARELDIPCIIETGFASKILKTGDLIEVDANKGIVRIIEKIENK
ncbi:MAG: PEP-utilizing enzyme [Nanoarchaeota archaeon]|nr:PEP-utilizing enzyme [Nanoarchaeota archaeon]